MTLKQISSCPCLSNTTNINFQSTHALFAVANIEKNLMIQNVTNKYRLHTEGEVAQ